MIDSGPRRLPAVLAGGQLQHFTISAVDLRVKGEIRCEALGPRGINAALRVANDERRHGRRTSLIEDAPLDRFRRSDGEENRDLIAVPEVLCALPDIERQSCLASARLSAVELYDPVLQHEPAQRPGERLAVEHQEIQPQMSELVRQRTGEPPCLRTDPPQDGCRTGLVVDFDEEVTPPVFHQLGRLSSRCDFHSHFRIDLDTGEAMTVEHALNRRGRRFLARHFERRFELLQAARRERRAEVFRRGDNAPDLCDQGLQRHVGHNRQVRFARFGGRQIADRVPGCHAGWGSQQLTRRERR